MSWLSLSRLAFPLDTPEPGRAMLDSAQQVSGQIFRSDLRPRSNQLRDQPVASPLPVSERVPTRLCPRKFLSPDGPCGQSPARKAKTSGMESAPSCCSCSPLQSRAGPPPRERYPEPASPRREDRIVCPSPSAHPRLSPRHSTAPRSHTRDHPYSPCARYQRPRLQSCRSSCENI